MENTHNKPLRGIGKISRERLGLILRKTKGYITPQTVEQHLGFTSAQAYIFLWKCSKNGWLKRIHQGVYLPIDFMAESQNQVLEDPWKIGSERFSPCYIGGWSAAQHWDLTDQIFESTIILTTRSLDKKEWALGNQHFITTKISPKKMFGLKNIWQDGMKIQISDPHKTIVDMLDNPILGGGIISVIDFLKKYLSLEISNLNLLIEYAEKIKNKSVFKRLGFLLSILKPEKTNIIETCLQKIGKGNTQLDPNSKGHSLVKKWHLWIPENFEKVLKKEIL